MTRRRLSCLILTAVFLASSLTAVAQLPAPNHPILFGYYKSDGRYGDLTSEVWGYTDTYVAEPCNYVSLSAPCGAHQAFADSLARAGAAGRKIFLMSAGD